MPPTKARTNPTDPAPQRPSIWRQPDAYNRLLAAFAASLDSSVKFDYRKIASMYGRGATYDAIEGRFRIIRREAVQLKEEVETGVRPTAPPRGGVKKDKGYAEDEEDEEDEDEFVKKVRKPSTPKQKDGVLVGRVSKNNTPTKPRTKVTKGVKEENESSQSGMIDEVLSGMGHDFGGFAYTFGATRMDADGGFEETDV